MVDNKKPHTAGTGTASKTTFDSRNLTPPIVTGQCAEVLGLIHQFQPVLSFVMTADHAIPEAAARVHNLRAMGFQHPDNHPAGSRVSWPDPKECRALFDWLP
jgi:hypothetical protein